MSNSQYSTNSDYRTNPPANGDRPPDYVGEAPPMELEQAEIILLYCITIAPNVLPELSTWLHPDDFGMVQWRNAYWAAQAIHGRGEDVSAQSIIAELTLAKLPCNLVELAKIVDPVPGSYISIAGYETYAKIIKEGSRQRQSARLRGRLAGPNVSIDELLSINSQLLALARESYPSAPTKSAQTDKLVYEAPELPAAVRLSPSDEAAAATVGGWLNEFVAWASTTANQTPLLFLEASGLFLGAVAINRRLYINASWGPEIYPNLYIMMVAVSTYYRKSAGLDLAQRMLDKAMPHMRLANPGSPESFQRMLAGEPPKNFDSLSQTDREHHNRGARFAAQRGIIRDELSGLFKSMGRDYMAGMKELLMELFDSPALKEHVTQTQGAVIIRNAALSLIGATTPAELSCSITAGDWQNGHMSRFALLTPEPEYTERPDPDYQEFPDHLATRLRNLYSRLPEPPQPDALGNEKAAEHWALAAPMKRAIAYGNALRQMTDPNARLIDDRLRGTYGRLHVQALKIAIILAGMDWADQPAGLDRPVVTEAHWCRAQQIVESWRRSSTRLLSQLNETAEGQREDRIVQALRRAPDGVTIRSLCRNLHLNRKEVEDTMRYLVEDGITEGVVTGKTTVFRLLGPRFR